MDKFIAYYSGVKVGTSSTKEGAMIMAKHAEMALFNSERLIKMERRLRRIRNAIFDYDSSGKNIDKVKAEVVKRRSKFPTWNCVELQRAIEKKNNSI